MANHGNWTMGDTVLLARKDDRIFELNLGQRCTDERIRIAVAALLAESNPDDMKVIEVTPHFPTPVYSYWRGQLPN